MRRLFDDAYPGNASELERCAARRLGCRPAAARRNLDLAIWAPLAVCLISLSAAWIAGYIGGIRRYDVAPTLTSTRVAISTEHPRYLETFGALLFAGGVALAWALRVIARRRSDPASVALPWYLQAWKVAVLLAIGFVVNRGFIAYGANQGLKLTITASGTTTPEPRPQSRDPRLTRLLGVPMRDHTRHAATCDDRPRRPDRRACWPRPATRPFRHRHARRAARRHRRRADAGR